MHFIYKINEDQQNVTITDIVDCPKSLEIPHSIIHTDNREYCVSSVFIIGGTGSDNGLVCESITFASGITKIKIVRNTTIKELTLPETITELIPRSFEGCENLERVFLPSKLVKIGYFSFKGCKNLEEIIIPDSVQEIGLSTFAGCVSLKKVILSNNLTKLGATTFAKCRSLSEVVIPQSLECINDGTFRGCINLSKVTLHENLKFKPSSFTGCSSLKSLGGSYLIEDGVLYNHDKTEMYTWLGMPQKTPSNIVAPSTVRVLGDGFRNCSGILSIDLSRTQIQEIQNNTFNRCLELTRVILPETIKTIGNCAFEGCSSLDYVYLPNSLEEFGTECFKGSAIREISIPSLIKEIPEQAFAECQSLKYVHIPLDLKTISNSAFWGCTSIENVRIPKGFEYNINKIFTQSDKITFEYLRPFIPRYFSEKRTGAYTHGKMSPCPYCGSRDVQTFCDGTAECASCGGEYTYWR